MNDVIEVWSRSGENLEVITCIVLEIQSLEARRVGEFRRTRFPENGHLLRLLRRVLRSPYTSSILTVFTQVLMFTGNRLIHHTI